MAVAEATIVALERIPQTKKRKSGVSFTTRAPISPRGNGLQPSQNHAMHVCLWILISLLAFGAAGNELFAAETAPRTSAPLPRYQFAVGDEFTYAEENEIPLLGKAAGNTRRKREGRWQILALNHNSDGSWRLLVYRSVRLVDRKPQGPPVEIFSNSMLAYCDLFPDGRIAANPTLGDSFDFEINPYWLFVPLPATREALAKGWSGISPIGELRLDCSLGAGRPASPASVTINCVEQTPLMVIFGQKKSRRYEFDTAAGRLRRIEHHWTRDDGDIHWQHLTRVKLESAVQKPSPWIEQLKKEAEQFFSTLAGYQQRMDAVDRSRTVRDCETGLLQARQLLAAAQKSAQLELVRDACRARLVIHDRESPWKINGAKARAKVFARGPADWELTALDGTKHRLKDYRGKVVVLDFWYRYCPYCIKAFPAIKHVAERYKDKGVAVFGMNVDPQEADAQFVVHEKRLAYSNLKAQPATAAYAADELGYPVLYLLGKDGRVSEIHSFYSPDLADRLDKAIDRLLKNGPAKAR
jgi:peroxiredoxin